MSATARRFLRAAEQRFKEAQFLLEAEFGTGAVYVGGYAVECALKALLLSSEPARRNTETLESFRGSIAHDFNWLRQGLTLRKVQMPAGVSEALGGVLWWSTDLRYDPAEIDLKPARAFIKSCEEVLAWARRRL
jgi:HEPN domain-containing protein